MYFNENSQHRIKKNETLFLYTSLEDGIVILDDGIVILEK